MFANRGIIGGWQITKAMETARCKERITVNRGKINDYLMTNVIQIVGCKVRIIVKGGKTLYLNFVEDFKLGKYQKEKLEKFSALISKLLLLILEHTHFNQTSFLTKIEEVDNEALVIRIVMENKSRSEICSVKMISPRNNGKIKCHNITAWTGDRVVSKLKRMRLADRKVTAEAQVKARKVVENRKEGNEVKDENSERMDRIRGARYDTLIDKVKNKWDRGLMNIMDNVIVIKDRGVSDSRILNLNRESTEDITINYEKDKMEIWFVRMIGYQAAIIDVGGSVEGHQINWINFIPQKLVILNINSQKCWNKDVKVYCSYISELNSNKLRKTGSIKKGNLIWRLEKYLYMGNVTSFECTYQRQQGNSEGITACNDLKICILIKKVKENEHLLRINSVELGRIKKKTQLEGKRRVYINVIQDEIKKGKMLYMYRNLKNNWTRGMENKKDD